MPLILIYRKFYGWKLTVRLVGLFYVLMVVAGLVTELIFRAFGAVPVNRAVATEPAHVGWNYTTYLNLVFLAVAGVVWWLARNKARFGGGSGYAIDPVCGMQVRTEHAPARLVRHGTTFYFCADRCRDRFESDPGRYDRDKVAPEGTDEVAAGVPAAPVGGARGQNRAVATVAVDPVCGMTVDPETAAAHRSRDGVDVWFCGTDCAERFDGQSSS
jgi:YHS domain-containing protein